MDDKDKIKAACKMVGCKVKDLLKSRLTGNSVVLIVGPVGFKHVVAFEDLAIAPAVPEMDASAPPTTTEVEALRAASTFEQRLPPRLRIILDQAGLMDPETLRQMSDRALERVKGLGRKSVKELREILEQLG